jgi:hypothetical protein
MTTDNKAVKSYMRSLSKRIWPMGRAAAQVHLKAEKGRGGCIREILRRTMAQLINNDIAMSNLLSIVDNVDKAKE